MYCPFCGEPVDEAENIGDIQFGDEYLETTRVTCPVCGTISLVLKT